MYSEEFSKYGHTVAQILMTKDVIDTPVRRSNAESTLKTLLSMHCVPIVNENDSVSFEELNFGGNDTLSAYVALICSADLLINMSDIDGFYDADPRSNPKAKRIPELDRVDESVYAMAGGAGTKRGTGGMIAKLKAAQIAEQAHIPMMIVNGVDPDILYDIIDGKPCGTIIYNREV
jgi:glutamate 5-kinase